MTLFVENRPLLDRYRRGDRDALAQVYDAYIDDVAALVRRGFRLESGVSVAGEAVPARQDDLIQDVFLRAFGEQARLSYDGLSPFRPWLLGLAKNLMIDGARRRGVLSRIEEALLAEQSEEAPDASAEDEVHRQRLRQASLEWIQTLSSTMQAFVRLRFEEQQSQVEVARHLHMSRRGVRTTEARLRDDLRSHLRKQGFIE